MTSGIKKMRQIYFIFVIFTIIISGCIFTACSQPTSTSEVQLISLETYQNVGASVAEKQWSVNYDCSNFATQFYQNCYKAGLPCRVRLGKSGGADFTVEDHAWNSVKIEGIWVNWEPQSNAVYNGHTQTWTSIGWGSFVNEDIARIIYENIGKYVPKNIIDNYEIDTYWNSNSPFYVYFIPYAYCLSDDMNPNTQDLVSYLQSEIPSNNSGGIFITNNYEHLVLFFKYNNKYYGIEHLEANDPYEGRSVMAKELSLYEIIASNTEFTKLNINIKY
ncbi:MAG: hypothetical protein LBQ77_03940 [Treponema sp.]|jgi:hypothetical protein|nr:hypothetical protein [Treponema sp.]